MDNGTSTETASYRWIDFKNPDPSMIHLKDIAAGLSKQPRFNGQTEVFELYSVAQHSLIMSNIVPEEYALEALLHDATEAYMGDMNTPLKALCPDYKAIERRLYNAIAAHYCLPQTLSPVVKECDLRMLATEKRDLKPKSGDWNCLDGVEPYDFDMVPLDYKEVYHKFIRRFEQIITWRD